MKSIKPISENKWQSYTPQILLFVSIAAFALVFLLLKPIAQNAHYHSFANEISFFGIPNFANVSSNIGFILVGILGLATFNRQKQYNLIGLFLVLGIFLTGFGSGYYHYAPNNSTLMWDRIPMTIIFSSFFALILSVYFSEKTARIVWLVSLAIGIFSVGYWQYTESLGCGDLRLYALVQFLPMLLLFIILILNRDTNRHLLKPLLNVLIWYIIAKLFEHFDCQIHEITHLISGHPLKHLAASLATFYMLAFLETKRYHFSDVSELVVG